MTLKQFFLSVVLGLLVGAGGMFLYMKGLEANVGGSTATVRTDFSAGLSIGPVPTSQLSTSTLNAIYKGTCNARTSSVSFAASTTQQFICPAVGVRSGDKVFATLPIGAGANSRGAGSTFGGFGLVSAYATTTDVVGFTIANNTGAATSSYPQATSSINFLVIR